MILIKSKPALAGGLFLHFYTNYNNIIGDKVMFFPPKRKPKVKTEEVKAPAKKAPAKKAPAKKAVSKKPTSKKK